MPETLRKNSSRPLATEYFLIPEFAMKEIEQHHNGIGRPYRSVGSH